MIHNIRHKTALFHAAESIKKAIDAIDNGIPEDLVSIDLQDAYGFFSEITGDSIEEDLIDRIFSQFCLGK